MFFGVLLCGVHFHKTKKIMIRTRLFLDTQNLILKIIKHILCAACHLILVEVKNHLFINKKIFLLNFQADKNILFLNKYILRRSIEPITAIKKAIFF